MAATCRRATRTAGSSRAGSNNVPSVGARQAAAPASLRRMLADDRPLSRLLDGLNTAGEETRIVGGAIRNALLGTPVHDFDLATTILPDAVMTRLLDLGVKAVPTGITHGTVTAVIEGRSFEITTLRQDIATDGRRATVRFGRDFKADALRRDFTINALSLDAGGVIHDYTGGLADIEQRRVRFIGEPDRRIAEDYLRILRFFRFSAIYSEGALDAAGLAACAAGQEGIETLSRERIGQEMRKLLVAERAYDGLCAMSETGILARVVKGVSDLPAFAKMIAIERNAGLGPDLARRLAALTLKDPAQLDLLRDALRLSNAERDTLAGMTAHRGEAGPEQQPRFIYRYGQSAYINAMCLRAAFGEGPAPSAGDIEAAQQTHVPLNPFRATEFIAKGLGEGPQLGQALKRAEDAWIADGFPTDPARIDAIATAAIAVTGGGIHRQTLA